MSERIHDIERGGYFAVRPDGTVSMIPSSMRLKEGWRLALESDIAPVVQEIDVDDEIGEGDELLPFDLSDDVAASAPSDPEPDAA